MHTHESTGRVAGVPTKSDNSAGGTSSTEPSFATLTEMLTYWKSKSPAAVALRTGDNITISFCDLEERVGRVAAALRGRGLQPGARVALLDRNTPVCVELLFAASRVGAVLIPLNWRLTGSEITQIAADLQIDVLVVGAEFVQIVEELRSAGFEIPTVLVIDGGDEAGASHLSYGAWTETPSDADNHQDRAPLEADPERVVLQIYTSGTTGRFKGVMLTESVMNAHLGELASMIGYSRDSVNLTAMPLFHVAGVGGVLLGMVHGGQTILLRDADVDVIAHTITKHRVTHGFLVPVVVRSLLDRNPAIDWSHFQTVVYGASAISVPLLQRAIREMECSFVQIYGLTESRGASTLLPSEAHDPDRPDLLRSCGKPLPWVTIRIVDPESGDDVDPGTTGEIWIKSPQNMAGYSNAPAETAQVMVAGGWLRTGDAAHADDDGWIFIDDRIKDMIVSGGENIYPAEIERLLDARPDVKESAVIAIPHERWGETPAALVVPHSTHTAPSSAELIAYCREHLARYKCPSIVEVVGDLPRNASGKILKKLLRETYWAGRDRRVN